jgi:Ser/Thr protein kinase RdoA (MazF antagonist)
LLIDDNIVAQVSADDGAVVAAAVDRVDLAYARLERKGLTVINCDLWHDNIKVLDEELAPFDFEDTVFGHRIHDVAIALLDPATLVGIDEYERLLAHFHRGYESVRALPDGDGLDFQVGRMFW